MTRCKCGRRTASTFRVFADFEVARLGRNAVRFLMFLESAGELDAAQREIVIERALAIDDSPLPLSTLKVVVLMVLWSQQADINLLLLEELLTTAIRTCCIDSRSAGRLPDRALRFGAASGAISFRRRSQNQSPPTVSIPADCACPRPQC